MTYDIIIFTSTFILGVGHVIYLYLLFTYIFRYLLKFVINYKIYLLLSDREIL